MGTLVAVAPAIAFVAVIAVVSVRLAKKHGWGVLLPFSFNALALTGLFLGDASGWMLLAVVAAPVCCLAGAIAGFVFARRAESAGKRRLGQIGGGLSVAMLLFAALVLLGMSRQQLVSTSVAGIAG